MDDKDRVMLISVMILSALVGGIFWLIWTDCAIFPESRVITITSSHFTDGTMTPYWDVTDSQGNVYEIPLSTLVSSDMFPVTNWNTSPDKTITIGKNYSITIWHSIFGRYTTDTRSNWDPNPSISNIKAAP